MVFARRMDALKQYITAGHQVSITYSVSSVSGKFKAKVNVSAVADVVPVLARPLLLAALQPVLDCNQYSVIVDRGHTYSDGHSCACFWISPLVQTVESVIEVPQVQTASPHVHTVESDIEVPQEQTVDEDVEVPMSVSQLPNAVMLEKVCTENGVDVLNYYEHLGIARADMEAHILADAVSLIEMHSNFEYLEGLGAADVDARLLQCSESMREGAGGVLGKSLALLSAENWAVYLQRSTTVVRKKLKAAVLVRLRQGSV